MAEDETPIRLLWQQEGANEAEAAVDAFVESLEAQAAAAELASEKSAELGQQFAVTAEEAAELAAEMRASQGSTRELGGSFAELASRALTGGQGLLTLAQRVQGTASAVQALVSATGSRDRTAGLVASIAGATAQFAAMGSMLGPTGTVVGGLLGLTQGITAAVSAHNEAEEAARAQARAAVELANDLGRAESAAVSLATRLREVARTSRLNMALGTESDYATEIDRLEGERRRVSEARTAIRGIDYTVRAPSPDSPEGRAYDELRVEYGRLTERIAELQRLSAESARETAAIMEEDLAEAAAETERRRLAAARGGRGGASPEEEDWRRRVQEAQAMAAAEEQAFVDMIASINAELETNEAERMARREEEIRRVAEEEEKAHQRKMLLVEKEREARARVDEERRRRIDQEQKILTDFGNTVGGVFAGAFQAAISGQESFDVALLKGTKQALMQYGTTMVAEGIGALLTGIGNTVLNPPAAATKLAEGAGKVALGVGLGAAGAAIPVPSASASAPPDRRPEDRSPREEGAGGSTMVVNMNAPTVMGGTHAEVGRAFLRAGRAATHRFGRAA